MKSGKKILAVEDEEDILELLRYNLVKEGYSVDCTTTGEEALEKARASHPNLILLDIMLPGLDGLEVCRRLKAEHDTKYIPIIMLTAKGEESDIVAGLELGADDYVTKPFSPKALIARIRAVLRRRAPSIDDSEPLRVGDILIHPGRHEALLGGEPVDLTAVQFRLLHCLARRPGWVFTREQIMDAVHGERYAVTERSVDVQVVGLRKKLGKFGRYIQTVRGVGYKMRED